MITSVSVSHLNLGQLVQVLQAAFAPFETLQAPELAGAVAAYVHGDSAAAATIVAAMQTEGTNPFGRTIQVAFSGWGNIALTTASGRVIKISSGEIFVNMEGTNGRNTRRLQKILDATPEEVTWVNNRTRMHWDVDQVRRVAEAEELIEEAERA
jgi:hypothetical protein